MERAKWIGRVTALACNVETFPPNYNEDARWKAEKVKRKKLAQKAVSNRRQPHNKTPEQGGHALKGSHKRPASAAGGDAHCVAT